jgi:hypothetical protein
MFSKCTIAAFGAFSMIATTAMTAHAQPRHHSKAADTDSDTDPDADTDTAKPKSKSRTKARAKTRNADPDADADGADTAKPKSRTKARARTKAKARDMDAESDADADADAEREREREKEREREREKDREAERERAREKEAAEAEAARDKVRDKVTETASDVTGGGGGGGEAYQSGTLGFSIPITVLGGATGGAGGEPVPTVDIVYFLDDKAALDLIVGLNVHRKHTVGAMGAASDSTLIGAAAGLGYRMYSSKNGLRSFLEPQAVISWPDTSSTSAIAVNVGGSMGLERNLTPWFSVSGAVGATLNLAGSFKDIQLATAANLAANLYWR